MRRQTLAIDLGASSGRVVLGVWEEGNITLKELHRFANEPIYQDGHLRWDIGKIFKEIKEGIRKSKELGPVDSLAVDTWGVDFGLLDKDGNLLENPVHYRDSRTEGMMDEVRKKISKERLYEITGNQLMEINTVFQLCYLAWHEKSLLKQAKHLLLMPDLFHYLLCGTICSEYSIASTTQMMDGKKRQWSQEVLDVIGIPKDILPQIVFPGTSLGVLSPGLQEELGVGPVQVVSVAGHDTQSAMAAVPAKTDDFIFVSCGTWSLFGTELLSPCMNEAAERYNLTNEGGVCKRVSFLKNISGTWLIQECRRQWKREGRDYSFSQLEQMAAAAPPSVCLIDPDDPDFVQPGDMPKRIRRYARRTGQPEPKQEGEIVRCINESLARKFKTALDEIRICTGKEYSAVYLTGGGSQSRLLCQMTADACGLLVYAGPVEATVFGNVGIQLMALGEIEDLQSLRNAVGRSQPPHVYKPVQKEVQAKEG